MNISPKTTSTFSSREFNQDTARAKRAANLGPVFITDRGKPEAVRTALNRVPTNSRDNLPLCLHPTGQKRASRINRSPNAGGIR